MTECSRSKQHVPNSISWPAKSVRQSRYKLAGSFEAGLLRRGDFHHDFRGSRRRAVDRLPRARPRNARNCGSGRTLLPWRSRQRHSLASRLIIQQRRDRVAPIGWHRCCQITRPVTSSTTVSFGPPSVLTIAGRPQACASITDLAQRVGARREDEQIAAGIKRRKLSVILHAGEICRQIAKQLLHLLADMAHPLRRPARHRFAAHTTAGKSRPASGDSFRRSPARRKAIVVDCVIPIFAKQSRSRCRGLNRSRSTPAGSVTQLVFVDPQIQQLEPIRRRSA